MKAFLSKWLNFMKSLLQSNNSKKEHAMDRLTQMLIRHEGLRLKPYNDSVGKLTIGVGRNLEDIGITESEAMGLLKNDIERVFLEAHKTFKWFEGLNNARRDVILNMIFNLGLQGFLGFKRTIAFIEDRNFEAAAAEMLNSKWHEQVGRRAVELSEMMARGDYLDRVS